MNSYSLTWFIFILPVVYYLYTKVMKKYKYFEERQIPHEKGIPVLGSIYKVTMSRLSMPDWLLELSHKYRTHRFFGIYNFVGPTVIIQDPELIKQIKVKDFDNFVNHPHSITTDSDTLLSKSLNVLRDQKWRDMRATLSPAFTGSKMRMMFDLIRDCAADFNKYCRENCENSKIEINTKDIFSKVTLNIISTTAFGLNVDTVRDPKNPILVNAKKSFDIRSLSAQLKFMMIGGFPKLANFLGIRFVPTESNNFFRDLVADIVAKRRNAKEPRDDLLQLLLQAQDGTLEDGEKTIKKNWTDDEIAAQCFLFFIAGYDTTSTLLTFAGYELAVNEDVQQKLYKEVQDVKRQLNGKPIDYEHLQKMQYMDAFVSEVLRKHPPGFGFITDRVCNADTLIEDHNGKQFKIEEGTQIWTNIYGLHHNHKYFPNPTKFDPERFMGENKNKIIPNTYIPFGIGPRACIGARFALMEAKIVLYSVMSEFSFETSDKTLIPMKYMPGFAMVMVPKEDVFVTLKAR